MWLHRKKGDVESTSFGDAEWTTYEGAATTETPFGDYSNIPIELSSFQNGQLTIDKQVGDDFSLRSPRVSLLLTPVASGPPPDTYDVRVTSDLMVNIMKYS